MNYLQLLKRYPRYIGNAGIHYFVSGLGQTFLISLFVGYFDEAFNLHKGEFTQGYALATLASGLILPFIGPLVDKVKLKRFSLGTAFLLIGFLLLVSFSVNKYMLFVGLFGLRLTGLGMMILAGSTSITRYFGENRGKALSLSNASLPFAEAVMPIAVVFLLGEYSIFTVYKILAAFVLLVFVPSVLGFIRNNDSFQYAGSTASNEDTGKSLTRKGVMSQWTFYLLLPTAVYVPFLVTGLFINHEYLLEYKGWTKEWLASCFVVYGILRVMIMFLAGPLVDRFSARKLFVLFLIPILMANILLLVSNHPYVLMAYLFLVSISASVSSVTCNSLWAELYGVKHLGAIKSIVSSTVIFATSAGALLLGFAFRTEQYLQIGLTATVLLNLIVIGLAVIGIRKSVSIN